MRLLGGWYVVWAGFSAAWMLLTSFFFINGAVEGFLQRSVLGFSVYYDSETVLRHWRNETGRIMADSRVLGKKTNLEGKSARDFAGAIDTSNGEASILESQQAWLTRYPGASIGSDDDKKLSKLALAELDERYHKHLNSVASVWLTSFALLLLPPALAYLLLLGLSRLAARYFEPLRPVG